MSYFEENMLENESKCNNVTFWTQNSPFSMCCYSISVIFQFLKVTDSWSKIYITPNAFRILPGLNILFSYLKKKMLYNKKKKWKKYIQYTVQNIRMK